MRIFTDMPGRNDVSDSLVDRRSLGLSAAIHLGLVAIAAMCGACSSSPPEMVVPIDMTIVPPESADAPPPPETKKTGKDEPPKLDDKLDAVEKIAEKEKPGPVEKKEEKKPERKRNAVVVDKSRVVTIKEKKDKPEPASFKAPENKTANQKPLSLAEIQKALAGGARWGDANSISTNEMQTCLSIIKTTLFREWERESFSWHAGLRGGIVSIQLGNDGSVKGWRLENSTGSADVDNSIKRAMGRVKKFSGLTRDFTKANPSFSIEFKPAGR